GQVLFPAMAIGEFGSMAVCVDPTGVPFGFWQAGRHVGSQVNDEPGSAAWYELYSPDAGRARDFYTALLRATAEPMPGDLEYYVLRHGEDQLCGVMQIDPAWGALKPQWITYFAVADADAAVAAIAANGGTVMSAVEDTPFGRMAAVADPGGAHFKVIQPPQG
ncbi:MAG TPA: VOC family protein, partial [Chloroflexaceae bacterium]|nr:VOC family protein [Chloroflexaceae bacterium]